ncbi:MAG: sugar ABC transporter permease [Micrococcales bacterium]|nr:sugar ABC transporter permease [Micrococcales bacterium]
MSLFVVFLGLPLALFLVFVIWPFLQAAFYSLTDWTGLEANYNLIGVGNFVKEFQDQNFTIALRNNLIFALVIPIVTIVIALAFASLITIGGPSRGPMRGIAGSSFYRVVSFFPYVIPAIVIGLIWAQIFDPSSGLLNQALIGLGLPYQAFAWLGEPAVTRWCLMFVVVWGFVGFYMVLFIAGIKGVPAETYEAARIDGCGRFRMATRVTLPLIVENVQTAYIYLGITALDLFVYTQALTPNGGPENTTLVIPQLILRYAFLQGQAGYASAMGVTMAVVTLGYAGLVFLLFRLIRRALGSER